MNFLTQYIKYQWCSAQKSILAISGLKKFKNLCNLILIKKIIALT